MKQLVIAQDERTRYLKEREASLLAKGTAPYGYCPECGALGVCGTRCRNPLYTCANGHEHPHTAFTKTPLISALFTLEEVRKKGRTYIKHKGLRGSNTPQESKDYVDNLGDLGDSGPAEGELPSGGGYEGGDGGAGPGGAAAASVIRTLKTIPKVENTVVPTTYTPRKLRQALAAPVSDKQRKLAQLRKKKSQLQEKKHETVYRLGEDIQKINTEIRRVKYDNRPGLKPKAKPAKKKPKSYAG